MPPLQLKASISAALDDLCDRFEDALQAGERPPLESWLTAAGSHAPALLVELAALELHYRILAGEVVDASDYFQRFPQLLDDATDAVRVIAVEYRAATSRNPQFDESSFRLRYSELAARPEWNDGPWGLDHLPETHLSPATAADTSGDFEATRVDPIVFLKELLAPPVREGHLGRLGEYNILGILGAGAMGVVLAAEELALGRNVAIKLMRPEVAQADSARERFMREARAAAAIEHPRVVVIHSVGEWNGTPYLVMPMMRGRSLAARLRTGPPVTLTEAVHFVREATDGVAAAHTRGLIHRDIKPDNIWLEESAEGTHVRLLDFGLAWSSDSPALTQKGRIVGTPNYMAPEQAEGGQVDGRADLFSLGCVLYELLTGRKAFPGRSVLAVLSALASQTPEAPHAVIPRIPSFVSDVTMRLLPQSRELRPESAEAASSELRRIEALLVGQVDRPLITSATDTHVEFKGLDGVEPEPQRTEKSLLRWHGWPRKAAAIFGALLLVVFLLNAQSWYSNRSSLSKRPQQTSASSGQQHSEQLWVKSIEVRHFAYDAKLDQHTTRGILGKDSFLPLQGDSVRVTAKLSRPAYSFMIAFRPDGQDDVCFPAEEDVAPQLTDSPQYPLSDGNASYGLAEGTGLWAFAVVASDSPLPSYRDWRAEQSRLAWDWASNADCTPGVIWWDDGQFHLVHKTAQGHTQQTRGKGVSLKGPHASILQLTNSLRSAPGVDFVSVLGFCVAPRPE